MSRWSQRLSVLLAFLLVVAICWGEIVTTASCALALGAFERPLLLLPFLCGAGRGSRCERYRSISFPFL